MPRSPYNPKPPVIRWSRTCPKCQHTLYRTSTGNVIDYRHQGAETQCPKLQLSRPTPAPLNFLEPLLNRLIQTVQEEPSQEQFALDA